MNFSYLTHSFCLHTIYNLNNLFLLRPNFRNVNIIDKNWRNIHDAIPEVACPINHNPRLSQSERQDCCCISELYKDIFPLLDRTHCLFPINILSIIRYVSYAQIIKSRGFRVPMISVVQSSSLKHKITAVISLFSLTTLKHRLNSFFWSLSVQSYLKCLWAKF
jgi:hypothetical protein